MDEMDKIRRNYHRKMSINILKLADAQYYKDIKIVRSYASNKGVYANKLLLAAGSYYFYCVVVHQKSCMNHIFMPGIDPRTLKIALNYIYHGKLKNIPMDKDMIKATISTFKRFNLMTVVAHRFRLCSRFMTPITCFDVWQLAIDYRNANAERKIAIFIAENLEACSLTSKFQSMNLEKIIAVFSKEQLDIIDILTVAEALCIWIIQDKSRNEFLPAILSTINVNQDKKKKIEEFIAAETAKNQIFVKKEKKKTYPMTSDYTESGFFQPEKETRTATKTNLDIRKLYLTKFESPSYAKLPSSPLVDKSRELSTNVEDDEKIALINLSCEKSTKLRSKNRLGEVGSNFNNGNEANKTKSMKITHSDMVVVCPISWGRICSKRRSDWKLRNRF